MFNATDALNRNQYKPFTLLSPIGMYANGAVDTSYDYAVPELGTVPLLNSDGTNSGRAASSAGSDQDSIFSKVLSRGTKPDDKKVNFLPYTSNLDSFFICIAAELLRIYGFATRKKH